jgi:hypothetical protein
VDSRLSRNAPSSAKQSIGSCASILSFETIVVMINHLGDVEATGDRAALEAAKAKFGWRGVDDIPHEERIYRKLRVPSAGFRSNDLINGSAKRPAYFYSLTRPDTGWPHY